MDGNDKSRFREDPNGLLVLTAPLDGAGQVYVPTHMRYGVMMREHYPPPARHPRANKMYTSMQRWLYWESMVVDVYAFVANCTQCERNLVGKRRKTNYLKKFPPTEPLTDLCMDLLGPLPRTAAGNEHLSVIVDRFSKMTRVIPLQRIGAETIAAASLDYWVVAYGPPATVFSHNGPQFHSTFFQRVCSLLWISNRYSTYVSSVDERPSGTVQPDHRGAAADVRRGPPNRLDELVSMLTRTYNSRPHRSTGVAPLEFVTPERVRSLSVKRMVGFPKPEETDGNPRAIREFIRMRLRNLIHKVRRSLTLAQRRYIRNYDPACGRSTRTSTRETGCSSMVTRGPSTSSGSARPDRTRCCPAKRAHSRWTSVGTPRR